MNTDMLKREKPQIDTGPVSHLARNLTSFWYNVITSPKGEPDPEDFAVVPESCGGLGG